MWTFGNLLLKDIIQTQPTLSVQSVGVFMADFNCFDFVVRSFAALDLTGVFRRFFGVDVAFATFDGDLGRNKMVSVNHVDDVDENLDSVGFLTEMVRLARRWEFR